MNSAAQTCPMMDAAPTPTKRRADAIAELKTIEHVCSARSWSATAPGRPGTKHEAQPNKRFVDRTLPSHDSGAPLELVACRAQLPLHVVCASDELAAQPPAAVVVVEGRAARLLETHVE